MDWSVWSVEAKSEVLKRAKLLKGTSQFSRTFIQPDLTVNQQKADKELRVKLKDIRDQGEREAKIKSGKIIKNAENGEVITLYQPPAVNQWRLLKN